MNDALLTHRTTAALLLVGLLTYSFFHMPAAWNETSRFSLVRSIVERGRLDIDAYHEITGDKARVGDHFYSDKAPGTALLAVPSYFLYYQYVRLRGFKPEQREAAQSERVEVNKVYLRGMFVASFFSVGLIAALLLAVFYRLARHLGAEQRPALLATVALGFGSLAFPYATMFYGHQVCGALLFISFGLIRMAADVERRRPLMLAIAGCCAAFAVVTEYPAFIPAALLAGYAVYAAPRRELIWFVVGGAAPALLLAIYHTACFGAPWAVGYSHVDNPMFEGMHQGFMGLTYPDPVVLLRILFGTYRGYLFLCPVVFFGVIGLVSMRRSGMRVEFAVLVAIILFYLLLNSAYYMWWGGSSLGARHSIPMLPFLILPIAFLPGHRAVRIAFALALVYSVVTMLVATAVGPEPPERLDPVLSFHWSHFLSNQVAVNSGSSNLGLHLGLPGVASLIPLLAIWAVVGRAVLQLPRQTSSPK